MKTSESKLVPQREEDIEEAVWMTKSDFFSEKRKVYRSIEDVLLMI